MTARQFYDWQTAGGTDDVMRLVDCLERGEMKWCAIGGVAVNHWAAEPMVTQDVDFVAATEDIERTIAALAAAGFAVERFRWSVNFKGRSKVSIQFAPRNAIEITLSAPWLRTSMASCSVLRPWKIR